MIDGMDDEKMEEVDFRLELDEFMEDLRHLFKKNVDPDGRCRKFAIMYLNAAGIDENDIDGVHYLLNRSLDLESQYLEELKFIDNSEVDRIHYLNDKIEKCRGISAGLMAIVLDYKEDSDFLM